MPLFSAPSPFTNKNIGARGQITNIQINTNETTNTVQVFLHCSLRSGQSVQETVASSVRVVLLNASQGGANWEYTWSSQNLTCGTVSTNHQTSAQAVTGDVNDYRRAQVFVTENA